MMNLSAEELYEMRMRHAEMRYDLAVEQADRRKQHRDEALLQAVKGWALCMLAIPVAFVLLVIIVGLLSDVLG